MNLAPASPTELKYKFLNRTYIFLRIKVKYNQCKIVKNIITEFVAQHDKDLNLNIYPAQSDIQIYQIL